MSTTISAASRSTLLRTRSQNCTKEPSSEDPDSYKFGTSRSFAAQSRPGVFHLVFIPNFFGAYSGIAGLK
ncbi:hypothetical protein BDN72DRAFT_283165 [Pluteus cervinus]|uniref:Uncharacterized protein n=1 Tax=Pluteus cervinus TaxID=181527 RepID=A0ACD3B4V9_9AGAR|nr:hypothetical protein BDN72DRAFT_283165 [Pluteus cervinus]